MQKRSVVAVVLLTLFTFGIYHLIWLVKTKNEMEKHGARCVTAWIFLIPFGGLYYLWKYSGGVEHVTRGKQSQAVAFLVLLLTSVIGVAIVQSWLNQAIDDNAMPQGLPQARVA